MSEKNMVVTFSRPILHEELNLLGLVSRIAVFSLNINFPIIF